MTAALAGAAQAQEDPVELPPLILGTALRDDRDIRDTPVAATVAEGENLERRQADTYEELIGDIPGVVIEGGPRGIAQEPNIRGFQDEQVVLRVDGGRLNFNQAHRGRFFFDPDIVQRVEVVRGGGSTLFGSGAIGGVIAVDTKDATDLLSAGQTTGARLRFGFSDNGEVYSPTATVYGDWGKFDTLAFIGTRQFDAPLDDGAGDDILRSEVDKVNGVLKFGFEPTPDHRFELSLSHYDDEGTTPAAADSASRGERDVERSAEIFTGRLSWDWNPRNSNLVDLSVLIYGNELDIREDRLVDGRADQTEYDTFGFEVVNRSRFDIGIPVSLVYGIEVFRDTQSGTRNGDDRVQFPDSQADTTGLFAEATFGVTNRLDFIAGVRHDDYSRDVDDPTLADVDETFFSPRIGFSYRPNDTWQLFGNLARAFRAPTLTELYNDGEHFSVDFGPGLTGVNSFVPNPDLEEEESTQVELGARFERADFARPGDILRFSVNAYYAEVDNFIDSVVTDFDFSSAFTGFVFGTTSQRNVDAELYGFEAEMDYDAGLWFAGLGLSMPRGKQKNGEALGSIPQERLVTTLGYRPLDDLELGLRATFAADQDDVPEGGSPGESYGLLDMFGSWVPSDGPLEGSVFRAGIDNVFDEDYTIYPNELPQSGRTFKVSVSHQF
ncbi:TonB-dependent hemoglobin/transferrin/lactoferrin family receptor [Litoreibacter roseus]|uniref:TonB-dependent hemoglobin/transferrin/lactoferrin family receptor n=1 Tax=Litoreibacter roseus TaxID=2601869 RepID=UPI0013580263|nr:TonB-dependent hemoglobin/transferrin/lactoferrin family receptor [Litoreibacter roseus]